MKALFSEEAGTSTLELALVTPMLALLVLGAADIAMAVKAKLKLQTAAERVAQMATSGGLNSDAYQNLAADAAAAAAVPVGNVAVTSSLQCDDTVQASMDAVCTSGQQVKRYVAINITGSYKPMFTNLYPNSRWSSQQGITLTGAASVRLQ